MTTCPRCGATNDADRAACWNCFAPLAGALASRVKPMNLAGHGGAIAPGPETAEPAEPVANTPKPKKKGLFGKK